MGILSIRPDYPRMKKTAALPKIDTAGVATRLEALRNAHGLQKGEFAESFGLDPSSYSKVIGDHKKPLKLEYGYVIASIWGVTMDYLYRGDLSRIEEPLRSKIRANLSEATA